MHNPRSLPTSRETCRYHNDPDYEDDDGDLDADGNIAAVLPETHLGQVRAASRRVPDVNDNSTAIASTSHNPSPTVNNPAVAASHFNNNANFSMRRIRTRSNSHSQNQQVRVRGFDRYRRVLENGAGESSQLLYNHRRSQLERDGSSEFNGFIESLPTRRPADHQHFDPDFGIAEHHYHDEALNFVASAKRMREKRSEICADFVREHFKCPICLDVLINSTALGCGHRFCKLCIHTWLKIRFTCPICEKRVSSQLPQYDVDNAIDSVADSLSNEWQSRRQVGIIDTRQCQRSQSSSASARTVIPSAVSSATLEWAHEIEVLFRNGRRYCRRNVPRLWRTTQDNAIRIYENITLNDVVKGVIIGSCVVLLFSVADEIVNFVQYMYYVIANYDKRIPIMKQIQQMETRRGGGGGDSEGKVSKYQEFAGGSDTIYAEFISLFYK